MLTETQLESLYSQGGYWPNARVDVLSFKKFPVPYVLAKARWALVESSLTEKRNGNAISILDVGAGHGFLGMAAARSKKFNLREYAAVEADESLRDSLRQTWDLAYAKSKLRTAKTFEEIEGRYEVIVLSHILEHLPRPGKMLGEVSSRLKEGGIVFIDVPHRDYLYKDDVFPHVLFFDAGSLKKLCEHNNLKVVSADCYGRDISESPLSRQNQKNFFSKMEKLLFKLRRILPLGFLEVFYSFYFGVYRKNPQGTWVRMVARGV